MSDLDAADGVRRLPIETGPDLERRFGGLRRLYGNAGYERIRAGGAVVVGVGGVGSWIAEGLARSGLARLTLIDLDNVSESNINRQVQALGATLGRPKVTALRDRLADIHPGCEIECIEEFVDADNWPGLLPFGDGESIVVDACDQVRAKLALAAWALAMRRSLVAVGAAGGKCRPEAVEVDDLARATHDPLLASLRQRLRQSAGAPRRGPIGIDCVFSREAVVMPAAGECAVDGSLNCHGYGSTVAVTATFGMVAVGLVLRVLAARSAGQTGL